MLQSTSHFLFCQVQCGRIYIEVYLIHLDLSFVHGDRYFHSSTASHPVMPAPFVEEVFFLPLYNFGSFVENQVFIGLWINIQVFDLIPLFSISVFVLIPSCFHYCSLAMTLPFLLCETY